MTELIKFKKINRQSRKIRSLPAGLAALLLISVAAGNCRAGITVGDRPPGMSESQYYQMAADAAEKDLERKKAVGQRRYDQRMAYRESVINGMRSQLEARRKMIDVAPVPVESAAASHKVDFLGYAIWTLAIAVLCLAGWQFYRSRQPGDMVEA